MIGRTSPIPGVWPSVPVIEMETATLDNLRVDRH